MLTLFTAITGGMNWEDAMEPLRDPRVLNAGVGGALCIGPEYHLNIRI